MVCFGTFVGNENKGSSKMKNCLSVHLYNGLSSFLDAENDTIPHRFHTIVWSGT